MKHQLLVIHGGDTFATYEEYIEDLKSINVDPYRSSFKGWKSKLADELGEHFDVIQPSMPNKQNAKYLEWKIWFEKHLPFLDDGAVLMGHSLGGMFLAKYLSEEPMTKKIRATILVAACYDIGVPDFSLHENFSFMQSQAGKVILMHSKDDEVVPFSHLEMYADALPESDLVIFDDRGHFHQETFPEMIQVLQSIFEEAEK